MEGIISSRINSHNNEIEESEQKEIDFTPSLMNSVSYSGKTFGINSGYMYYLLFHAIISKNNDEFYKNGK